jgi:hypothetical protein
VVKKTRPKASFKNVLVKINKKLFLNQGAQICMLILEVIFKKIAQSKQMPM